jgi:protein TonB
MFEFAFVEAHGRTSRPYTFVISLAGQCGLIGLGVLLPLMFTEALPQIRWVDLRLPSLPSTDRPVISQTSMTTRRARPSARTAKLFEPATYPPSTTQIVDAEAAPASTPFGVPGGTGEATDHLSPVIVDALRQPPSPLLPPVRVETPAATPPAPTTPLRIGGDVKAPRPLHTPAPEYPFLARQARVSGTVRLEAVITTDGGIRSIRLIQGHPLLTAAAIAAVKGWRYTPPTLNGEPIEVIMQVDVNFALASPR